MLPLDLDQKSHLVVRPLTGAVCGYLHRGYAESLSEFGNPRYLPHCGGWILERFIPGTPYKDAMGCYPLFICQDVYDLHIDLAELAHELVTLVLVTGPFSNVDEVYLRNRFDLVKPFKYHYIADLSQPIAKYVSKHHRYYARKSLREIEVIVCHDPLRYIDEWISLYDNLIKRHHIRGIRAFSPECFRKQLNTPGMVLFVAERRGEVIGARLAAIHDNVAYSHLSAFSDVGYRTRASYGIYLTMMEYLVSKHVHYIDLGAAAGLEENPSDGLSQLKKGWSNMTRMVYLCGQVFDQQKYTEACRWNHIMKTNYFPAYRDGEFT